MRDRTQIDSDVEDAILQTVLANSVAFERGENELRHALHESQKLNKDNKQEYDESIEDDILQAVLADSKEEDELHHALEASLKLYDNPRHEQDRVALPLQPFPHKTAGIAAEAPAPQTQGSRRDPKKKALLERIDEQSKKVRDEEHKKAPVAFNGLPYGYILVNVAGDGDCLFHAISKSISSHPVLMYHEFHFDPHHIRTIRQRLVSALLNGLGSDNAGSIHDSIHRMSTDAWSEDQEIQHMSKLLNLCIRVWDVRKQKWRTYIRGEYEIWVFDKEDNVPEYVEELKIRCPENTTIHIHADGTTHYQALIPSERDV